MPSNSSIRVIDALTTRKGAVAGAVALLALGLVATTGSTPAVSTGSTPAASTSDAGPFSPEQKQAIERIVKDYLLQNPEILIEVGKELEKRQATMQVAEQKRLIVENSKEFKLATDGYDVCGPGDLDGDGRPDLAWVARDARLARAVSVMDGRVLWSVDVAELHRRATER